MTGARSLRNISLALPLRSTAPALAALLPAALLFVPASVRAAEEGSVAGVVSNAKTKEKVANALVVVQCTCLQEARQTYTNANGLYSFRDLPPGTYTVQVLAGQADVTKVIELGRGAKPKVNFVMDPNKDEEIVIRVESTPVEQNTSAQTNIQMEEFRNIPTGGAGRDFTQVVDVAPTASRDAAGITLAGTTGAESKYVVDGADVTNPSFGTVGVSIVQEFIEEVEVQESGYDAEFGGVAGGVVSARRLSGTNKVRGVARFTYTPRLAKPRFIVATDNAIRATETPDYGLSGVVAASGPIIKDKLFWSAGVAAIGGQASLVQSFHHRVDKDESGGFEDCPYENGAFDCADGADYIATEKFAEQKFKTGNANVQLFGGIDWAINQKHKLGLTFRTNPSFVRRTYRRPLGAGADPSAFGTNPTADIGGQLRVANGVVNRHFGWDRGGSTTVVANYLGRVADDKLEIESDIAYSTGLYQEAWKLDNPELLNLPATQYQDVEGENLFELLDREGRLDLVPGVKEACNDVDLPGLSCPTRSWLSGGVGQYSIDRSHRVQGNVALTHFFNAAGSHQLKYGTQIDYIRRRSIFRYSGENSSDFYDNCEALGFEGGGEYCYDPSSDQYLLSGIGNANRVDNHRFIFVDTDSPDNRQTVGYGRVRKEQGDLRAIATPLGAGIRASEYNEATSTINYGVFLQDKWAILDNLFLSAGVRWDLQDMRDIMGERAVFIWDNVAPRVGVVYDWTKEGRSRLYASYGWFYQNLPLQLNSRVFGGLVDVRRTYRNSDCEGAVVEQDGERHPKTDQGQPTEWCTDFNSFTNGLLAGAVVPRLKGQYNQQFQVGYEQEVIEDLTLGVRWLHTNLGRAVEDVSTNGGTSFLIANPGVGVSGDDIDAQAASCAALRMERDAIDRESDDYTALSREIQRCEFLVDAYQKVGKMFDKPTRNYDAFTFEVKKRFARNWLLVASYTYSRLVGNYDGFVDPITGAINIGASTQYDLPELVRNTFGPLSSNVPHRVKIDGAYSFDLQEAGRLTLGTSFRMQSGFPISVRGASNTYPGSFPIYIVPRGAAGNVEPNYYWNVSAAYSYPLPGDLELEVAARLINITNSKSVIRVDEVYTFQNTRPIAGGELSDLKHAKIQNPSNPTSFFQRNIIDPQGNYGVELAFQTPLAAQFDLVLRF